MRTTNPSLHIFARPDHGSAEVRDETVFVNNTGGGSPTEDEGGSIQIDVIRCHPWDLVCPGHTWRRLTKEEFWKALEEEKKHYENTLLELAAGSFSRQAHFFAQKLQERWKQQEKEREEERHQRVLKEKEDRDEQLRYEKLLKDQEEQKCKDEEIQLVDKIVCEMEADQKRHEKKKAGDAQGL